MNTSILGIYEEENLMISAMKIMSEKKIPILEVYTPYPVHEVFKLLKRKSRLHWATLVYSILGLVLTYLFLYWTSVISYPLIYGGKPYHSIPSFIIVCFVMTLFFGILFTVITFFVRSKLYPGKKVAIIDPRITDNCFVILIKKTPEMSSEDIKSINSIFKENGAIDVIEK